MKNIYQLIVLVLITTNSIAQDFSIETTAIEKNDNTLIQLEEDDDNLKDELDFRYYYFPNLCAYYDLETNNYIYKINNQWETASELPQYYGGYSSFKNVRIPIKNYIGDAPQEKLNEHKQQFPYVKKSRMLKSLKLDGNTSLSSINY